MEYGIRRDLYAAALFGVPAVEAVLALGCAGQRGQLLIGGGHAADRGRTAVSVKGDDELGSGVLLRNQRKPRCGFVPCAVLCAEGENTAVFIQRTGNGKGSVAVGVHRLLIIAVKDLASRVCRAGDFIAARSIVCVEHRSGERQHGCCFVHAYQQEYAGHIRGGAACNIGNAIDFEHQTALKVGDCIATILARRNLVVGSLVHSCDFESCIGVVSATYRQRIRVIADIGMVYAVFVGCAFATIHGERQSQRCIFGQKFTLRCFFLAVILTALDGLVRPHAHLVGFVCGQVFGFCRFCPAHGQRHVDRSGILIKVIAETSVLKSSIALLLINTHSITLSIRHGIPFGRHDLITSKLQRNILGRARLVVVRIGHFGVKLLAVDGNESFFKSTVLVEINFLFRHQERSHIVFARRGQRTALRNRH